jgi:bacillithiol synthase
LRIRLRVKPNFGEPWSLRFFEFGEINHKGFSAFLNCYLYWEKALSELKFEELPDTPNIWIDFLRSRLSFLPASREVHTLHAHANAIGQRATHREDVVSIIANGQISNSAKGLENIQKLRQSGSVAVIANFNSNVFGGPVFQIWKCLTAIKVSEKLAEQGISAVPICWINADPPPRFSTHSISLLDPESELYCLRLSAQESHDLSSQDSLSLEQTSAILKQIGDLGRGAFDAEMLDILQSALIPEHSFSSISARLISGLFEEWGMIVLDAGSPTFKPVIAEAVASLHNRAGLIDPLLKKQKETLSKEGNANECSESSVYTHLIQSLVLPAAVSVVGPFEMDAYAGSLPIYDALGMLRPRAWPQCSATIVDVRSRRILERYNLNIHQLFSGEDAVIRTIRGRTPSLATKKLDDLKSEAETLLNELATSDSIGVEFVKSVNACKEKVVYQLERLRELSASAQARKEEVMRRQIHKACNFLAPRGSVQERELAGILIPLHYSLAGLRFLYDKLDILTLKHQLISMD